ncbi:murein hydrolase activator EnvC [Herbiconiux sp. L3-i23]|uniref:murein hydrolase activator EnvC family protein n=1 Tax=Herbiconiux sp. L3-i23 TaxID=2905871 RepID=UPI00207319E3|nr:M23 family metallopeptidase [Herbiconiux sp. L3-i23]
MAAVLGLLLGMLAPLTPTSNGAAHAVEQAMVWQWPVPAPRIVVRGYDAPATRYSAGHRGIDLDVGVGTTVTAVDDGVVSFAGWVVDRPVVSVRHSDGLVSSVEAVDPAVAAGDTVRRGDVIGVVAESMAHCAGCLHLGARQDGEYLSPLALLGGIPRAVLLPLVD